MRDEDDAPIKALDAISERCHGLKVEVVGGLVQHEDVRLDVPDEDAMYRMTQAIRGHQESITGNQSSTYETAVPDDGGNPRPLGINHGQSKLDLRGNPRP